MDEADSAAPESAEGELTPEERSELVLYSVEDILKVTSAVVMCIARRFGVTQEEIGAMHAQLFNPSAPETGQDPSSAPTDESGADEPPKGEAA